MTVLLLIFNRPDLTKRVFAAIRDAKPSKLFIAADGPREGKDGEEILCELTQSIVLDNIDWECEVHTLLRNTNLGCKVAVSSAIDWYFDKVEEGIVLEDDTLPSQSFFTFCEEMLTRYRDDERVTSVCGGNLFGNYSSIQNSYSYSRIAGIWGWASWRRVWKHYDVDMHSWKGQAAKRTIAKHLGNKIWYKQYYPIFEAMSKQQLDTWDFQWIYTQQLLGGLVIIPSKNLIKNIGFGSNASHTFNVDDSLASLNNNSISFPLKHPKVVVADDYYDTCYFLRHMPQPYSPTKKIVSYIKTKIKIALKFL